MRDEQKEKPLTDDEITEILNRQNHIEVHSKDKNGKILGTIQINVKVLKYKWVWAYNKFKITPIGGNGTIWKNWDQLKSGYVTNTIVTNSSVSPL